MIQQLIKGLQWYGSEIGKIIKKNKICLLLLVLYLVDVEKIFIWNDHIHHRWKCAANINGDVEK